jgi:hypothetical protein
MMMILAEVTAEGIFGTLIESTPIGAAMLLMVWMFMRHLDRRDDAQGEREERTNKSLEGLSASCHAHQEGLAEAYREAVLSARDALKHNTSALGRNDAVLARAEAALDR